MCHPKDEAKVPSASPFASVAQLVEQRTENPRVVGSIPTGGTIPRRFSCGGPKCECSSSGRAPPCQGGGSEFEPRHSLQTSIRSKESFAPYFIRCHSQVVRQSSAKAPRPSSNLGGTSIKITTPLGVVIFMDTEGDFICSGSAKPPHLRAKCRPSGGCAPKRRCGGSAQFSASLRIYAALAARPRRAV